MGREGHSSRLAKGLEGTVNALEISPREDAADAIRPGLESVGHHIGQGNVEAIIGLRNAIGNNFGIKVDIAPCQPERIANPPALMEQEDEQEPQIAGRGIEQFHGVVFPNGAAR